MSSLSLSVEDLPGNVIADILTRLPVKTIIHCKCVCKKWREYVSDSYFVNLHLSRSPAGIMIHHNCQPEVEDLPGNVIADILTRLPVKTIIHCKCVCKKWREYVSDSYFVNLHLSRSPAGIMIHHNCQPEGFTYHQVDEPGVLKWLEIERRGLTRVPWTYFEWLCHWTFRDQYSPEGLYGF
ncbi:F-box domain-containing protein [Artemisia annua]|uniref:F-box domain-containing protein n=1 Tax=Artemisia annua TaxID=35608 RepID=A0A2U1PDZ9_ARTAN|nr:F-box domain-containing protein [Artemisia annua]